MAKAARLRTIATPLPDMTETETEWDGIVCETQFFSLAPSRFNWLLEHGALAAVQPFDYTRHIISVSAYVENDKWNGWDWMQSEFDSAGLFV